MFPLNLSFHLFRCGLFSVTASPKGSGFAWTSDRIVSLLFIQLPGAFAHVAGGDFLILRQLAVWGWDSLHGDQLLARAHWGSLRKRLARVLTGFKLSLGFLRKVYPDQDTTSTFEIPACGSGLLVDRTEEHHEFLEEGKAAESFASVEKLLDRVKFYCNECARKRIACGACKRCIERICLCAPLYTALDALKRI